MPEAKRRLSRHRVAIGITAVLVATVAYAFTVLTVDSPIVLSIEDSASGALGTGASKSKLLGHRDGTMVTVYGDFVTPPPGVAPDDFLVYDLKTQAERPPRDVFARTCRPGDDRGDGNAKTCMVESDWTAPVNLSGAATSTSLSTDWRGDLDVETARPFWGDAEKPNGFVNPVGVTVVSWVSHYCPDGDPGTAAIDPVVQRAPIRGARQPHHSVHLHVGEPLHGSRRDLGGSDPVDGRRAGGEAGRQPGHQQLLDRDLARRPHRARTWRGRRPG